MRVTSVLQTATSADRPMTVHVIRDLQSDVIVVCMSPGSAERSEPKMMRTSRVP